MVDEGTTYEASRSSGGGEEPRAYVAVVDGQDPAVVDLPLARPLSIGRSRSSGIVIEDRAASRLHATLLWDGGDEIELTDHGSRNGTCVDGRRVEGKVALRSGTEVAVGKVRLVVALRGERSARGEGPEVPLEGDSFVARDPAMLRALALAERAARTDATVLLVGETGAGKEVVARWIHERSARREGPFVAVNCGAVAETLAESAFFGHEKGAFTGATTRQKGYFEAASSGSLFLDEIGELSAGMQVLLLRALEERAVTRVGGTEETAVDVRILAATNKDLGVLVRAGSFREDLHYRLDVVTVEVPPLRARPADVVPLAVRFLEELTLGGRRLLLTPGAQRALEGHAWPGNVRQLRNVLERSVALCDGSTLGAAELVGLDETTVSRGGGALHHAVGEAERAALVEALEACGGNQTHAARRLGISRRAFIYKLEKHGLKPPPRSSGKK